MFHVKQMLKKDILINRVKDFIVSKEYFNIYKDLKTGIVWTDVHRLHDHFAYYKSQKYIPHSERKGFFGFFYNFFQKLNFRYKRVVLKAILKKSKVILDYGSGDGKFAEYLEKKGNTIIIYDPLNKKQNLISGQNVDNQLDIIMMWHVLEHIPDLQQAFPQVIKKLNKTGLLIVAVPNRDCFDAKHYKSNWAAWDAPRHLFHFNHKSLEDLMTSYNFTLVSKKPLFLDSFYVSYLSEKYKKSYFPIFFGFIIGFVSNCLAIITTNYSSSIYVFKRN